MFLVVGKHGWWSCATSPNKPIRVLVLVALECSFRHRISHPSFFELPLESVRSFSLWSIASGIVRLTHRIVKWPADRQPSSWYHTNNHSGSCQDVFLVQSALSERMKFTPVDTVQHTVVGSEMCVETKRACLLPSHIPA